MALLDAFIGAPRLREVDRVAVAAPLEKVYEAVRHVDAYRLGFVRALFSMRQLPNVISARLKGEPLPPEAHGTIDDLVGGESQFRMLCEVPQRGFVVGAIGKFWQPQILFTEAGPDFATFHEPGWGKVAWSIELAPRDGGGTWVSVEVRVTATDDESWHRFERYWSLLGPFSHAIRRAVLSMLQRDLFPGPPPAARHVAGDRVLPNARYERTFEKVIEAAPEHVWPWLAQLGCQRGGWYALDSLDNGGQPSADRIHPEWQKIEEGDLLYAAPDGSAAFGVLSVEKNRALVLGSPSLRRSGPPAKGGPPADVTWAFALEPIGTDATLLTVRLRAEFEPSLGFFGRHGWELLAHEVMQRAQLEHLARRAAA